MYQEFEVRLGGRLTVGGSRDASLGVHVRLAERALVVWNRERVHLLTPLPELTKLAVRAVMGIHKGPL